MCSLKAILEYLHSLEEKSILQRSTESLLLTNIANYHGSRFHDTHSFQCESDVNCRPLCSEITNLLNSVLV